MKERRWALVKSVLKGNYGYYLGTMIATIVTAVIGFLSPLVLSVVVDSIIGSEPVQTIAPLRWLFELAGGRTGLIDRLWLCGAALVALSAVSGVFQYLNGRWTAISSENIARSFKDRLYRHLNSLEYNYHVKAETGDLIQRCTSDVDTVRRFLSSQLMQIVRCVAMLAIALSVLIPRNGPLTVIALALVPFIFLFSVVFFKKVTVGFKRMDEAEGAMSTTLQESLTGTRVVRVFGRQSFEVDKFDQKSADFRDKAAKFIDLIAWFWCSSDLMCMIQSGIVLIVGSYMAARGQITLGTVLVFTQYTSMLLWPIRNLGRVLSDMGKSIVSLDRIDAILMEQPEKDAPRSVEPPIDRDIEFDDVSFWYDGGRRVLDHVSFHVKQGQTVALLGATGSGKSTMMLLLQRLYENQEGAIRIGGVDIKKIKKKWLRERVGIVLQEPFLYSRTVRDNIAITRPDASMGDVERAVSDAAIRDSIDTFEKGYDTIVGERGVTLSGGQKQRVAIARTLMRDNDILIFDDSLSAVDTQTDAAIRHALRQHAKKVTTFIISHRVVTLSEADMILVLEDGKIAQRGTHEQLIAQEGLYKRINSIQSALEDELGKELAAD